MKSIWRIWNIIEMPFFCVCVYNLKLTLKLQYDTETLLTKTKYGRKWRTKEPLKVKEESEKCGLKLNIQKTKIMASGPITSWQTDGETMKTVTDFIFLGSKITADGDCSHEIERGSPWKKSYDQPRQHIKKQRHFFANKDPSSES